jgi:hypothetical protein
MTPPVPTTITLAMDYATHLKACFDVTYSFSKLREHVDQTEAIIKAAREVAKRVGSTDQWQLVAELKQALDTRKE